MHTFQSPDPLDRLSKLKGWQAKKLPNVEVSWYLGVLKMAESELQEKLNWVRGWQGFLEDLRRTRETAAHEERIRQERYDRQVRDVQERNARLEEQYHRDTYAE